MAAVVLGLGVVAVAPARAQGASPARTAATTAVRTAGRVPAVAVATTTPPAPPPPTPPPPPAPPPPLPVPAPLPDRWARVPLTELGRIQIPKTGVDQVVREGVEQMVIDAGPAHWRGTAAFGGWGNVVLAGHRSVRSAPFLRNGELVPGDVIVLSDQGGVYTYRVTKVQVVPNTALWIVDQHPGRTLTIFACHPIGSAAQRLAVFADLVTAPRPGA